MAPSPAPIRSQRVIAALAGVASALAGLGCGELVAGLAVPSGSPIAAVGAAVIAVLPGWFIHLAIGLFGTADKAVLLAGVALVVLILGAIAGMTELARPPIGRVIVLLIGALALVTAVTRPGATAWDALPSVVATVVGALVLGLLIRRLRTGAPEHGGRPMDRRTFLAALGGTAVAGILATVAGQALSAGVRAVDSARALFKLPRAAEAAAAIPAGAALDVAGITPLVTPNADFYRIDTALSVPRVDAETWSLKITGLVKREVTVTFDELVGLPLKESTITLACVSNPIGGDLIGNATWLGYPIRDLLALAGPMPDADMVLSRSSDGFTAGTPLEALTDGRDALLAIGMNGEPLPLEHGYPVRMVVPGLYGYVSATKWVVELKVTRFDRESAYWTGLGWSERGPIKLSSRIDVPRAGATVQAGLVPVGGIAWAQHTGISAVQVRVDTGEWQEATLGAPISADTWRQWVWQWPAEPGRHLLSVRAVDAVGKTQTAQVADVLPDGATGLHRVNVTVI